MYFSPINQDLLATDMYTEPKMPFWIQQKYRDSIPYFHGGDY